MKPTALIAEDETLLAENLRQELARLWPELQIVATAPHGQAALDAALRLQPDICFLDIRMPGMSGLEAAQAMTEDWPQGRPFPLLVFVTAYEQYALQAFERAAVDYVLKPVLPERLAQTCQRLQAALALRQSEGSSHEQGEDKGEDKINQAVEQLRLLLGTSPPVATAVPPLRMLQIAQGSVIQMLPVDDVLYFEAADKYVRVLTNGKEHLMRTSLRELLPQLDAGRFWQIHRSVLVRSDAIDRAVRDENGKVTLHLHGSKDRLTVSRMYAHLFKGM